MHLCDSLVQVVSSLSVWRLAAYVHGVCLASTALEGHTLVCRARGGPERHDPTTAP